MKNLLQIVIVTIITSFLFSSCARNMSIAKRKYTKGYYIARTGKKQDVHAKQETITLNHDKAAAKEEIKKIEPAPIVAENQNEAIAETAIEQANELSKQQSVEQKKAEVSKKDKFVHNAFDKGMNQLQKLERITGNKTISSKIQTKLNPGGDAAGDVLSLFWIIILILLLLYLLGILFDGFGLGWAIHLFALIILILLILWLLRIV